MQHPSLNEEVKSQAVRLLDVFVLGPGMLYAASVIPDKHLYTKAFLAITGITTMTYNWRNWQRIQKAVR
jgi:hypothetical protein